VAPATTGAKHSGHSPRTWYERAEGSNTWPQCGHVNRSDVAIGAVSMVYLPMFAVEIRGSSSSVADGSRPIEPRAVVQEVAVVGGPDVARQLAARILVDEALLQQLVERGPVPLDVCAPDDERAGVGARDDLPDAARQELACLRLVFDLRLSAHALVAYAIAHEAAAPEWVHRVAGVLSQAVEEQDEVARDALRTLDELLE
jgi:hypothetical protein